MRTAPFYTYNHSAKVVPERDLPDRQLVDLRARLLPDGRHLPGRVRRRAVLRRLLARLHLGDGARRRRRSRTRRKIRDLPHRRRGPGRPRDRARRRPLLRRPRRRDDPAHPLHAGQPAAARGRRARPRRTARPRCTSTSTRPARATRTRATRSTYAWDLDGDGAYDDATGADGRVHLHRRRQLPGGLRVTDDHGASATDAVAISAGNTPPTATITSPDHGLHLEGRRPDRLHRLGDRRRRTAPSPPSAPRWTLVLHHCPSNCHTHDVQTWTASTSGSFTAPDHEYPSYLELELTATDSGGPDRHADDPARPEDRDALLRVEPERAARWPSTAPASPRRSRDRDPGLGRTALSAPTPQTLASGRPTTSRPGRTAGRACTHHGERERHLHRHLHQALAERIRGDASAVARLSPSSSTPAPRSAVVTRSPVRISFRDGRGRTVLAQVANRRPAPLAEPPTVDPEPGGVDLLPETTPVLAVHVHRRSGADRAVPGPGPFVGDLHASASAAECSTRRARSCGARRAGAACACECRPTTRPGGGWS